MDNVIQLTPGHKIYNLFNYDKVIVKGKKDTFIIRIEKINNDEKSDVEKKYPIN
ncbi:hypothetical protein [Thermoanaerobacterium sp. DL9XJH110]|uniref:hypothetical protein n=1 Tax=Thermoanaerobacterium sp. DL9XJH110 TaxID=3386643 RepID=UPI003BB6313C